MSSPKDESFPWISSDNMSKWEVLFRAHLRKKQADDVLSDPRPKYDAHKLTNLAEQPSKLVTYKQFIIKKRKKWDKSDAYAYSELVKACSYNPIATTVVLENKDATAAVLYKALKSRFDMGAMTGVIQAKLAAFNSMVISSSQTAEMFINTLVLAKIDLHSVGCTYIDYDVHCLGRLKEGLMLDMRFKDVALNLACSPDMTWERAVKVVAAYEASTKAAVSHDVVAKPQNSPSVPSAESLRRLKQKFTKKINNLKSQLTNSKDIICHFCKKRGHKEAVCRFKQKVKGHAQTPDKGMKTCTHCGKQGHTVDDCYQKHPEKRRKFNHVDAVDYSSECSRMLSHVNRFDKSLKKKLTLDSGATSHMMSHSSIVDRRDAKLVAEEKTIQTAKHGETMTASRRGHVGNLSNVLILDDGALMEDIASVPQLDIDGKYVLCGGGKARILDGNMKLLAEAPLGPDRTYRFELDALAGTERALLGSAAPPESLELYHRRLGHRNKRDLGHAIKLKLLSGVSIKASVNKNVGICDSCAKAKSTRHSFSRTQECSMSSALTNPTRMVLKPRRTVIPRVDTDIKGPFSVSGLKNEEYFQLFTEIDSKMVTVKCMKTKAEAINNLREFVNIDLASEGLSMTEYHSDAAPELISNEVTAFLASKQCRVSYSPPYTPELNGIAERKNRTIWESAYSMWLACNLPASFWPHAVMYAVNVNNCLPTNTAWGWMSPFQAKYDVVPDVTIYKIFGCICYVHIDEKLRDATFAEKSYRGYFVGLKWPLLDRYQVFVPVLDKVVETGHAIFDEVQSVQRKNDEIIIVNTERKTVKDFEFLNNMGYVDNENNIMYVTTRVTICRGFIVCYRAPYIGGQLGKEEPQPVHARDVEVMLNAYLLLHEPLICTNGKLTNICTTQGAPMGNEGPRSDQPLGIQEPADISATMPPIVNPDSSGDNHAVGISGGDVTSTLGGKKSQTVGQRKVVSIPVVGARTTRQQAAKQLLDSSNDRVLYLAVADVMSSQEWCKESANVDDDDEKHMRWELSKIAEMFSLVIENDVWEVTQLPVGRQAISTKWVVKEKDKPVKKLKSRFTPRGFSQKEGVDYNETFAPVAKLVTLRIYLTLVAILSLSTGQLDLKTAFLNAPLEEEIYCQPVHDQTEIMKLLLKTLTVDWQRSRVAAQLKLLNNGGVLRMKKACYGLKQAPRQWWLLLHTFLKEQGFVANKSDICFYVLHLPGGAYVLLLLYVDDILLAATSDSLVHKYTSAISQKFRVSSEGPISSYLGIDIRMDITSHRVYLSMTSFVEKMFTRFKMVPKQSVKTPLPENFQAALQDDTVHGDDSDTQYIEDFEYRQKIGCLLYYMICMRPGIMFAVGLLSRYNDKVNRIACAGVTQVLQYVYNTRSLALCLGGDRAYITAYFDADWAGDRDTRNSTGAHIIYLGNGPVEWASKLHRLPAQSTAEAEFISANAPCRSIVWLRWLLKQTGIPELTTEYSSTLFGDNTASIAIAHNPVHHDRTKHIAIKYYFIRALVEAGVVSLEHIDTLNNAADIGTKALGRNKFGNFELKAMGHYECDRPTKRRKTEASDEFV